MGLTAARRVGSRPGRRGAGARATARARQVREDHGFEAEAAEGLAAGAGQPADPLGRGFKG